jgi:hypothetical protein
MFPWRLYSSPALRELRSATMREQVFSKAFFARPPPFLLNLYADLRLGEIFVSVYFAAGIVIGVAFLFVDRVSCSAGQVTLAAAPQ